MAVFALHAICTGSTQLLSQIFLVTHGRKILPTWYFSRPGHQEPSRCTHFTFSHCVYWHWRAIGHQILVLKSGIRRSRYFGMPSISISFVQSPLHLPSCLWLRNGCRFANIQRDEDTFGCPRGKKPSAEFGCGMLCNFLDSQSMPMNLWCLNQQALVKAPATFSQHELSLRNFLEVGENCWLTKRSWNVSHTSGFAC